jgi:VWFA-related protein
MRFSPRITLSLVCLASFSLPQLAIAQQAGPQALPVPAQDPHTITLHVVVSGKKGGPIAGLEQSDFAVHLDKKPVPILSFRAVQASAADSEPVQTILLIDAVNLNVTRLAYERTQIDHYLRQNGGKLPQPITLVVLTDTGVKVTPEPTQDGNALGDFLKQTSTGLREFGSRQGVYSWIEQFEISAKALSDLATFEATRPGRKILVWISPGWPLLSGPEISLSAKDQKNLFGQLVSLSSALWQANMTLTSVDPIGVADSISYNTEFYKSFIKGVSSQNQMQIGNLALQVFSLQSGGQVLNASNDITQLLDQATADARTFYDITIAIPPADHPNQYHDTSVTVEKAGLPGITARTRTGFYAQPQQP